MDHVNMDELCGSAIPSTRRHNSFSPHDRPLTRGGFTTPTSARRVLSPTNETKAGSSGCCCLTRDLQSISKPDVAPRPPIGQDLTVLLLGLPAYVSAPYLLVGLKNIQVSSPTETRRAADCSSLQPPPPPPWVQYAKERRSSTCHLSPLGPHLALGWHHVKWVGAPGGGFSSSSCFF